MLLSNHFLQQQNVALVGVAQWIEHWPADQKIISSIPSQGMCLSCGPGPHFGPCHSQPIDVSLSPSFPFSLKINKIFFKKCLKHLLGASKSLQIRSKGHLVVVSDNKHCEKR